VAFRELGRGQPGGARLLPRAHGRGQGGPAESGAGAVGPRLGAALRDAAGCETGRRRGDRRRRLPGHLRRQPAPITRKVHGGDQMRTVDVNDDLQAYLDRLVPPRDGVLARLEEEAHREGIPIVDPHEGQLLYMLVKIAGGKRILELGTATGYSGIWLLRGS